MDTVTRVHILDESLCILHSDNYLGLGKYILSSFTNNYHY